MSSGPSATKRNGNDPPERGAIAPLVRAETGAVLLVVEIEAVLLAVEIEAVRPADVPVLRAAVVRPTGQLAEGPAEIATARERAERTLPPSRWLGGSHCRRDV